jgi:hypothetical protein
MNIKTVFALAAAALSIIGFVPYIKDIFLLKTKPHLYTWLIWTITQGTAVSAIWFGGGSWGALSLTIGTIFVTIVFLFSLKYGTKNITKSDTVILIAALCAILIWWQLDAPLISVMMVTIIDAVGYMPSFRKSYSEPWSETATTWGIFAVSNIFAILALSEYNFLTTAYLVVITSMDILLLAFCLFRRQFIAKPKLS